jgi:hypothetical protein
MATITTLRPSGTSSGVGWSAVPSGTLHGVTSDDNDTTYALWAGSGSPLILTTPVDAPPIGERRHQVRLRARGEDGDAWWAVRLASGGLVAGAAAQFTTSPSTVTGSWGFGAPADGSSVLSTYVTGQSTGVKIQELYLDVDSREAPAFSPDILDGSGSSTTTISDTAQPIIRADSVDLDGLAARQYRYWVTLNGAIVWDTGIVSGVSVNRQTTALDNGSYVAHLQIWSTLGQDTAYASTEQTLAFTVSVGTIPAPDNPEVDAEDGTPFYRINACAPYMGALDDDQGYIEIQRVDCPVGGYLSLPGSGSAYASTVNPGIVPTDLEIVVKAGRDDDWRPATAETLAAHYDTGSNHRSWRLTVDAIGDNDPELVGRPLLAWSPDGTSGTVIFAAADTRAPVDPFGIVRLRVRLDVNNGAGGWTVTFETRQTDDDDWVMLGNPVTNSGGGTTSLYNASTVAYTAGAWFAAGLANELFTGRIYSLSVSNGPAGAMIVDPDFTNHLNGTREFEDSLGNEWSVKNAAVLYSPESAVSIAMLGPLGTGECAEWVDFSLPRTGVGLTCDHSPDPCCSYYRARTVGRVDGDLRISNWSDIWDPAIPAGVITMWPSTAASIPSGWDRVIALDSKFPKGIASAVTEPGTIGGSATHTHTVGVHGHTTNHSHSHSTNTGAATGSQVSTPGTAGTTAAITSHTHTRPTTGTATVSSGDATPTIGAPNNDPAKLEVIFVESDGTPLGVAPNALGLMGDIAPSGWIDYANGANRFFKGAAPAGNGGATAGSAIAAHTHSISAHTHTGTAHTHTGGTTGAFSSTATLNAGTNPALNATSHSHPITINSASTAALDSGGSGSSDATSPDDPIYRNLRVKQNISGVTSLPVGLITLWRGALGAIPKFWKLCDGTNGTPSMIARYPRGATASIGVTGGSLNTHTHTTPTHTHTTTGHAHTETIGSAAATSSNVATTNTVTAVRETHTHSASDTNSSTPTVGSTSAGTLAATGTEPPYEEVAFIQLTETPAPDDLSLFCLEWNSDEHLIRSTGPDGPIWAPILGKFDWAVDRPFTAAVGVNGSRFVTSAKPGGRNLRMTAAVESEADLATLRAVLARPLVLISPSDADEVWAAPIQESVKIIKIGRIRQITASFIGTGPQPPPQLADVE